MSRDVCGRRWQAEAIDDGRLDGSERASFERHAPTCPTCSWEQRSLRRLRELGLRLPEDRPGALERRRLRLEILRQADLIVTGASKPRERPRYALAAAAGLAVVLCAAGWFALRDGSSGRVTAVRASADRALAPSASTFARASDASSTGAPLRQIAPATASSSEGQGVRARTPAGVRLAEARDPIAHSLPYPALQPAARVGAAPEAVRSPVKVAQGRQPAPKPSTAQAHGKAPPSAETAGSAFSRAIAAFSQGKYALAEERLREFESKYPQDARGEDAAFLRAVCRQRRGDREGAAREAVEYLRRYPAGFRHREAGTLLVGF